jgi:transcription termination factor Rho
MTAEALEQSVLEAKDKTQLVQIADALGVKATSRLKKSDIIDKILERTGGPAAGSNGNGKAAAAAQAAPAAAVPPPPADAAPADAGADAAEADEPKAEWELALESSGGDADTKGGDTKDTAESADADAADAKESSGGDAKGQRGGDARQGQARESRDGDSRSSGQNRQGGDRQGGGDRQRQGGQQGGGQGNQQGGGQGGQGNQQGGQGNKRRRRRRKGGRSGQDGPQGEDRDLLEGMDDEPISTEPVKVEGYLDIRDEGYGFLRVNNYLADKSDSYIPVKLSRQYGLRKGDHVVGMSRPAGRNEKNPAMLEIQTVNGRPPEEAKKRPRFEDLTALFPDEKLALSDPSDPTDMTARIVDLVSPIGKGQRGLIVSPPKAGKTTVMQTIVNSIRPSCCSSMSGPKRSPSSAAS